MSTLAWFAHYLRHPYRLHGTVFNLLSLTGNHTTILIQIQFGFSMGKLLERSDLGQNLRNDIGWPFKTGKFHGLNRNQYRIKTVVMDFKLILQS